jgi:hypothetical protein
VASRLLPGATNPTPREPTSSVATGYEIGRSYDGWVQNLLCAFLLLEILMTVYMFTAMRSAYDSAYEHSRSGSPAPDNGA